MTAPSRPAIAVGGFLGLHLALGCWGPGYAWGGNLLAFCPEWVRGLFLALGGLLLIPRARQPLLNGAIRAVAALDLWGDGRRSRLSRALLVLAGGVAFAGLSSAAHLLGDGYLRLRELAASAPRAPGTNNGPLASFLLGILHRLGQPLGGSVESAYRLYSGVSGLLYLLIALSVARTLGRDRLEKTLILGFLLTPGYLQIFCGYVEDYPLVFPVMLLYLLTGLETLRGRRPLWVPAGLLGILIPLHFTTAALAPSLVLLAPLRAASRRETVPRALASLGVAPLLTLVILLILDFDPLAYLKDVRGTHFLPLLAQPGPRQQYRLFAPDHLLDAFNQQLLAAPSALLTLLTLLTLRPRRSPRDPDRAFLLGAAVFPLLFTFAANPEIGAFRDWDVLSFPALPLTLWAALALIGQVRERTQRLQAGFLICGAAALHSLLWVGLNANRASAEARYTRVLDESPLSAYARSYGWETLGTYHRDRKQTDQALRAYERAVESAPENPRLWNLIGLLYADLNQHGDALRAFQRSLRIDPGLADAHNNAGNVCFRLGRYDTAIDHFRKAIALRPDFAEPYNNAGNAYFRLGRYDTAIDLYQKALSLKPGLVQAHNNLKKALSRSGRPGRPPAVQEPAP